MTFLKEYSPASAGECVVCGSSWIADTPFPGGSLCLYCSAGWNKSLSRRNHEHDLNALACMWLLAKIKRKEFINRQNNKIISKECPVCKKTFYTANPRRICCSLKCRGKRQHIIYLSRRPRICLFCKKEFISKSLSKVKTQKFCSSECYHFHRRVQNDHR